MVCVPLPVFWLTSLVCSPSPGWMALSRLDFPTPDGPAKTEIFPTSALRRSRMPLPLTAEV